MNAKLPITIIPMTADHLEAVAELERICFSTPWSRNMLAEELENDCSAFLVALYDGRVVGYAGVQVVVDEGYIANVAVRPEFRRGGIAERLLRVFLRFAQANHLAFLTLEVRDSNRPAIALYSKLGFREAGRRRNYYEHPREDAILMTRTFGEPDSGENTSPKRNI
jgi:ribosomal-protein-alanine N-acetyltransferase